jgi:hypothetical protein
VRIDFGDDGWFTPTGAGLAFHDRVAVDDDVANVRK